MAIDQCTLRTADALEEREKHGVVFGSLQMPGDDRLDESWI